MGGWRGGEGVTDLGLAQVIQSSIIRRDAP